MDGSLRLPAAAADHMDMSPIEKVQHESTAARSFDLALVGLILLVVAVIAVGASGLV